MSVRALLPLAALALMLRRAPAGATVYKCTGAQGRVSYQEQPCSKGSTGDSMPMNTPGMAGGLPARATPEEEAWVARVRPGIVNACRAGGGGRGIDTEPLSRAQVKRMCECTANLYFLQNPISKLRGLEARGDETASMQLLRPLLAQCEKSTLAAPADEEQP